MTAKDLIPADIVAILAEAAPEALPPRRLKNNVLARIRASVPATHVRTLKKRDGWFFVTPLLRVKILVVDEHADSVSFMLHGLPGAVVPGHAHSRYEECVVLEGTVRIGELRLGPGDYHCISSGKEHPVISTLTGAVVFLRTAIRDCPVPV